MKKSFAIFFAAVLAMYVLAQTTRPKEVEDGTVHLVWDTDTNPARARQAALFMKLHPKIHVALVPGEWEKLVVRCATGTGPDIADGIVAENMAKLVEMGVLRDLSDVAGPNGFGPESTYPSIRKGLMVEGRQYRYPCNVNANAVIYNKQIFDELNLPYPKNSWTYDDFIAVAKKIRDAPVKKGGQRYIPIADANSMGFYLDLLFGHGGRVYSADGLSSGFDSPQSLAALRLFHDMIFKYKVVPDAAEAATMSSQGGWGAGDVNWFSNGRAAMIFIGRWFTVLAPSYPKLKGHMGAATMPHVGKLPSSGIIDARGSGINVNSKHPVEAVIFMQFLASPEYNELIVKDGDALPPRYAMGRTGKALVNEYVPDAAFHQSFVDAANNARPVDLSPFIDYALVSRWLNERIEKAGSDPKADTAQLLHSVADEINAKIRSNIERNPNLQKKYEKITGKKYDPLWWKTYQPGKAPKA